MKTDFSSPVATAEFSKFAGILSVGQKKRKKLEDAKKTVFTRKQTITECIDTYNKSCMLFKLV